MVGEAVRSALDQTVIDLEVVVVDDGSTDETQEVMERFEPDPRLRVIRQANSGRSEARNHGLRASQGDFVGFLDSDDQLLPGAIAAHLEVFESQPHLGMTVAGYRIVGDHGEVLSEQRPWESGGSLDLGGWLFDCYGMPGSVLHRRLWLDKVGGFEGRSETAEDWDLYLRMAASGCPMAWVSEVACQYAQHDGNSTRDVEQRWRGSRRAIERVFEHPGLRENLADMKVRALAWNDLVTARRAFAGGDGPFAATYLNCALTRVDGPPAIARIEALEFLMTPLEGSKADSELHMRGAVIAAMSATPSEVRAAIARTYFTAFFRAVSRSDWPAARKALWAGVRKDPRWLFNRGVLKLGLRSAFSKNRRSEEVPPMIDRPLPKSIRR